MKIEDVASLRGPHAGRDPLPWVKYTLRCGHVTLRKKKSKPQYELRCFQCV